MMAHLKLTWTSYDLKKMDEMFKYYTDKGCNVLTLEECMRKEEA